MADLNIGFEVPDGVIPDLVERLRGHDPSRRATSSADVLQVAPRNEIVAALGEQFGIPFWPGLTNHVDSDLAKTFDASVLRRGEAIPIVLTDRRITLALANPYNSYARNYCEQKYPDHEIVTVLVPNHEIERALLSLLRAITPDVSDDEIAGVGDTDSLRSVKVFALAEESEKRGDDDEQESVVRRIFRQILSEALDTSASDIHFKTDDNRQFYYFYRINGYCDERRTLDWALRDRIDAFIQTLAGIKREASNNEIGLDGDFAILNAKGRKIKVRYARHRTYHGYHLTLRILDPGAQEQKLEALGFPPEVMKWLRWAMRMSSGIVIISGATGSGKSTTMGAVLREVAERRFNTLSVENPVEAEIPNVTHCEMRHNSEIEAYLKAFLRSDPDIMPIGEVRDAGSAALAVEAARTGHQVFTTIHTGSAAEIIGRFEELGITIKDISRTLRLLCAQRLVQILCPDCSVEQEITDEIVETYDILKPHKGQKIRYRNPDGCSNPACRHGVIGRQAILEVIPINKRVSNEIVKPEFTALDLETLVFEEYKLKTLAGQGIEMLLNQKTDLQALQDVIDLEY